jgi:hypothetical protein
MLNNVIGVRSFLVYQIQASADEVLGLVGYKIGIFGFFWPYIGQVPDLLVNLFLCF